jgi:hypothetical protein
MTTERLQLGERHNLVAVVIDSLDGDRAAARFPSDPLPVGSVAEYRRYVTRSMDFIRARNRRIAHYAAAVLGGSR